MMDERDEKKRNKRLADLEKRRVFARDDFVRAALGTPQGRTFIYWLLEIGHIHRNPFTSNALTTSFACGELNVGKQVEALALTIAPDDFLRMLKERKEEEDNATRTDEPEPVE